MAEQQKQHKKLVLDKKIKLSNLLSDYSHFYKLKSILARPQG